jgi:adenosylcobinamide amidohydrolase
MTVELFTSDTKQTVCHSVPINEGFIESSPLPTRQVDLDWWPLYHNVKQQGGALEMNLFDDVLVQIGSGPFLLSIFSSCQTPSCCASI